MPTLNNEIRPNYSLYRMTPDRYTLLVQAAQEAANMLDLPEGDIKMRYKGWGGGSTLGMTSIDYRDKPPSTEIDINGVDDRNLGDLVNTIAHELFHVKQHDERNPSRRDFNAFRRWADYQIPSERQLETLMPQAYEREIHSISAPEDHQPSSSKREYLADQFGDNFRKANYPELPFDRKNTATLDDISQQAGNFTDSGTPLVEALINLQRYKHLPTFESAEGIAGIPQNFDTMGHWFRDMLRR